MQLNEVTQGKLETYEEMLLRNGDDIKSVARFNRLIIEAARDAGIAGAPADLTNLKPGQIVAWTQEIIAHIAAARQLPSTGE